MILHCGRHGESLGNAAERDGRRPPDDWEALSERGWEAARAGCGAGVACYAGDDDPYVPLRFSREIAERLGAPLRVIPGGKHLNAENGMTTFPELAADLHALLAAAPAARPGGP